MKKREPSTGPQPRRGFPYDHIAKALFHLIPSVLLLFDAPGTRKRMVSVEVSADHQPYFLDMLVEIILDRASRLYRRVRRRARPIFVHVEAISRFNWDIALRMIEYRPAILRKHGLNSLVLPYILVVGHSPAQDCANSSMFGVENSLGSSSCERVVHRYFGPAISNFRHLRCGALNRIDSGLLVSFRSSPNISLDVRQPALCENPAPSKNTQRCRTSTNVSLLAISR